MEYGNITVENVNEGTKIGYEQDGTRIFFGDDELMINAKKYQKDFPVDIDIVRAVSGNLTIGADNGYRYVAQLHIPDAEYDEEEVEAEDGTVETQKTKKNIDMTKVVLKLWSID